jgi:hypothetical protein
MVHNAMITPLVLTPQEALSTVGVHSPPVSDLLDEQNVAMTDALVKSAMDNFVQTRL